MKKLIPILILISSCTTTKKYVGLISIKVNDTSEIHFDGMVIRRKDSVRVFVKIDSVYDEVYQVKSLKWRKVQNTCL